MSCQQVYGGLYSLLHVKEMRVEGQKVCMQLAGLCILKHKSLYPEKYPRMRDQPMAHSLLNAFLSPMKQTMLLISINTCLEYSLYSQLEVSISVFSLTLTVFCQVFEHFYRRIEFSLNSIRLVQGITCLIFFPGVVFCFVSLITFPNGRGDQPFGLTERSGDLQ